MNLRGLLEKLRLKQRLPDNLGAADQRSVSNTDAMTAAPQHRGINVFGGGGQIPPDYVDDYDEGRPKK